MNETSEEEPLVGEAPPPAQPEGLDAAVERRLELILEALLLAADTPLSLDQMQKLVGVEFSLTRKQLREVLTRMTQRFEDSASELHEVASGWRLQVRPEYGEWVSRLWQDKPPKYSRALLETLALIVYRQPVTRGEIEDVRGVAVSSNILRTLLERGWVREVGHKEVPGRPALYGTTAQFLDDFNLKSLDQLPSLPEVKDLEQIEAALSRAAAALPAADAAEAGETGNDTGKAAGHAAAAVTAQAAEEHPAEVHHAEEPQTEDHRPAGQLSAEQVPEMPSAGEEAAEPSVTLAAVTGEAQAESAADLAADAMADEDFDQTTDEAAEGLTEVSPDEVPDEARDEAPDELVDDRLRDESSVAGADEDDAGPAPDAEVH